MWPRITFRRYEIALALVRVAIGTLTVASSLGRYKVAAPLPSPTRLANLAGDMPIEPLVALAKLRWRIERDYQELKQELGLGHFEGRGWRGFHHHASLCIVAYGFQVRERATLPPTSPPPAELEAPPLPETFRPRGSRPASAAAHRHLAPPPRRAVRQTARSLSLLQSMAQQPVNILHLTIQ